MAMDANALSIIAGQLAQAIAPDTPQAAVGGLAAQLGQGKILEQQQAGKKEQLLWLINNLTGEGAQTTGVTIGDNGELKFTGKTSPLTNEVQINQSTDSTSPSAGGGNQTANPFYQLLGGKTSLA